MLPESRAVRIVSILCGAAITITAGVIWAKRWLGMSWTLGKVTTDDPDTTAKDLEHYFQSLMEKSYDELVVIYDEMVADQKDAR